MPSVFDVDFSNKVYNKSFVLNYLERHREIKSLNLNGVDFRDSGNVLSKILSQNESLTILELDNCNLTQKDIKIICTGLLDNEKLGMLYLNDNDISTCFNLCFLRRDRRSNVIDILNDIIKMC